MFPFDFHFAGFTLMELYCYITVYGHGFYVHAGYKGWQDARTFCQQDGTDLAVLHSLDEYNQLITYLADNFGRFVGHKMQL